MLIQLTNIVLVPPLEPDSKIMVIQNATLEALQQLLRLLRQELVDALGKRANSEEALPSGDWVGPDDGVGGRKLVPDILRRTSRSAVDFHLLGICLGCFQEPVADYSE